MVALDLTILFEVIRELTFDSTVTFVGSTGWVGWYWVALPPLTDTHMQPY